MKVLVLGGGGREHALSWRLKRDGAERVLCAPGNGGTELDGIENLNIGVKDFDRIASFCMDEKIDIVVVGPEQPLCDGVGDYLDKKGISVFGPAASAARLEGSKAFAKKFMYEMGIPTSEFDIAEDRDKAESVARNLNYRCAIKVDGLAAGKGVFVCKEKEEVKEALDAIFEERRFGKSGDRVVVERLLEGEEASYIVVVSKDGFCSFPPSQDHKPIYDGDRGPNTGGMGAYAPAPLVTAELENRILDRIVAPTIEGLIKSGMEYLGFLYVGLMITQEGPMVLEYNVRLGDPETQPLLFGLDENLFELIDGAIHGRLKSGRLRFKEGYTVCVVLAQEGYPGSYEKGREIRGLDDPLFDNDWVKVFHAGTQIVEGRVLTSGGRVLGVTAHGEDFRDAQKRAYEAVSKIDWDGKYYRKDIGDKALKYLY